MFFLLSDIYDPSMTNNWVLVNTGLGKIKQMMQEEMNKSFHLSTVLINKVIGPSLSEPHMGVESPWLSLVACIF